MKEKKKKAGSKKSKSGVANSSARPRTSKKRVTDSTPTPKLFGVSGRMLLLVSVLAAIVFGGLSFVGLQFRSNIKFDEVSVEGNKFVDAEAIVALAAVPKDTLLFSIDPIEIEERVTRHPWVETVVARRIATGRLAITVKERTPVVVVTVNGRATHYLDSDGFRLPMIETEVFDLPVVSGVLSTLDGQVRGTSIKELLQEIEDLDQHAHALISELTVSTDGSVLLRTTPVPGGQSIPVLLGSTDFRRKLIRLSAFWEQVVLQHQDEMPRSIDLRYDGQILTT